MQIDVTFDHRADAGSQDPDRASATLRRHHAQLWSKSLPGGQRFKLEMSPNHYLVHKSSLGSFTLSSDTISTSMRSRKSMSSIISQVDSAKLDDFQTLGSTIGGYIVFPSYRVDGKRTINAERGQSRSISDRFDLTLECIRRFYVAESSPLAACLERHKEFFALFESFEGYVSFFHLQDLTVGQQVRFFLPFEGFSASGQPQSLTAYMIYMQNSMAFTSARNLRILKSTSQRT